MKRLVLIAAVALVVPAGERSVRVVPMPGQSFTPAGHAALFVGVREFEDGLLRPVQYAVDDAVDLAYAFSLEPRSRLIPPSSVVLTLSGEPVKRESKARLAELLAAGAQRLAATRAHIANAVEQQMQAAGPAGLLLLSFATHGFSHEGTSYVLASDSRYQDPESSLSTARLLDTASRAGRSFVVVDACRERVKAGSRAPDGRQSPMPLLRAMRSVHGQAVLAMAQGELGYDLRGNGVLTAAILAGMKCRAHSNGKGIITVETLAPFVERYVKRWMKQRRRRTVNAATQLSVDGGAGSMPLAECGGCRIKRVELEGATLKTSCWDRTLESLITQAEMADLDDDGRNEAIAAAGETIHVFNSPGQTLWSRNTKAPIRKFVVAGEQIAALSRMHLTIFDATGESRTCSPAGMLHDVVFDRPTARHKDRVIVAGIHDHRILLARVDPKKCTTTWLREVVPSHQYIERLEIADVDNDARRDITLTTTQGRVTVDFDGDVVTRDNILLVPVHKNTASVSSNQ